MPFSECTLYGESSVGAGRGERGEALRLPSFVPRCLSILPRPRRDFFVSCQILHSVTVLLPCRYRITARYSPCMLWEVRQDIACDVVGMARFVRAGGGRAGGGR